MDNEENEVIDLTEILSAVRQHLLKLIFVTLAAALVGFTASKFLMTPKYDSSALMIVNTRQDVNANVTSDQINSATKLVSTYSIIIKSDTVLHRRLANRVSSTARVDRSSTAGAVASGSASLPDGRGSSNSRTPSSKMRTGYLNFPKRWGKRRSVSQTGPDSFMRTTPASLWESPAPSQFGRSAGSWHRGKPLLAA